MVLFVLRKLILQTRMRSHPMGLDVWFLVGPFVYFHTWCVLTAKALARLRGCAGSPEPSLVAYVSTIISWAGSFVFIMEKHWKGFVMECFLHKTPQLSLKKTQQTICLHNPFLFTKCNLVDWVVKFQLNQWNNITDWTRFIYHQMWKLYYTCFALKTSNNPARWLYWGGVRLRWTMPNSTAEPDKTQVPW